MGSVINVLIVAATILLAARLYLLSLHRPYRAFFYYLIFSALQSVTLAVLNRTTGTYQLIWLLTEPIDWIFCALVVLELYSLVLQDYRGLYTVGRWSLIVSVSVALLASGFSLIIPSYYTRQGYLMAYYYVAERAVYFSLAILLLTILALLMRYPIVLKRNTVVHSMIVSAYFIGNTAIFLLLSTRGMGVIRIAAYAIQAVNLVTLGTWLVIFNTAGEKHQQRLRPAWLPGREEELVSQLNSLNGAMLRAVRN
jgi:hypothetical protein